MKKIVTRILLVFVAATVVLQIVKTVRPVQESTFADGKHLVYFHAKVRCPTCTTMEKLVDEVLSEDFTNEVKQGVFDFHVMDYEARENRRLVEEYKIATATVLLFEQKDGHLVRGTNLAQSCWKLVGNEQAFRQMLQTQMNDFLLGKESVSENDSEEISLDPNLNLFEEESNANERKPQ